MTKKEIYRGYLLQLQQIYNSNESAVITERVFEKVAHLNRADIIKNPDQTINPEILSHLNDCLADLLQHTPVQYVLGEAWFYKMRFMVNKKVLIPRPETEELVQLVVDDWRQTYNGKNGQEMGNKAEAGHHITILDIGTGSGCIAIAIKKNLQEANLYAIDISLDALSVAKENAKAHHADIQFLQADFLDETSWTELPVCDFIISNPPYIPLTEKDSLDKNVTLFEPHMALFMPENSHLLFYEKIAFFGKTHLRGGGKIYMEMHEDYAQETAAIFKQYYSVEIKKDLFGKERMLIAVKLNTD